jgi:hypothetical protein
MLQPELGLICGDTTRALPPKKTNQECWGQLRHAVSASIRVLCCSQFIGFPEKRPNVHWIVAFTHRSHLIEKRTYHIGVHKFLPVCLRLSCDTRNSPDNFYARLDVDEILIFAAAS